MFSQFQQMLRLICFSKSSTMLRSCRLNVVVHIIVLILHSCLAADPLCDDVMFGVPNYSDCVIAASKIPYATDSRVGPQASQHNLFSEPQYLLPPFSGIENRYRPNPINQIPKIWRSSNSILSVDKTLADYFVSIRHMSGCAHELWSSKSSESSEQFVEHKLDGNLKSIPSSFDMLQSAAGNSAKWRMGTLPP